MEVFRNTKHDAALGTHITTFYLEALCNGALDKCEILISLREFVLSLDKIYVLQAVKMAVRLIPRDSSDGVLELGPGEKISLGRKSSLGISTKTVSRDHCTITTNVSSERRSQVSPLSVFANKKLHIVRHGHASTLFAGDVSQVIHVI